MASNARVSMIKAIVLLTCSKPGSAVDEGFCQSGQFGYQCGNHRDAGAGPRGTAAQCADWARQNCPPIGWYNFMWKPSEGGWCYCLSNHIATDGSCQHSRGWWRNGGYSSFMMWGDFRNFSDVYCYSGGSMSPTPSPASPAPTTAPTPSPTPSPTASPTSAPTPSPTPSPTASPTSAPTDGTAGAVGDPHLQNIRGERFDVMEEGDHVLINIPRGMSAENALLRVVAGARRLGGHCADMYFDYLNVTGSWAEVKRVGGLQYSASQGVAMTPQWVTFGKVELKVVHGRTESGIRYLNLYAKHLGRAGFGVGGLLGVDDHGAAMTPPAACLRHMSLKKTAETSGQAVHSISSVAMATVE